MMNDLFERHRMYGVDELVESRTSHMGVTHTYIFSQYCLTIMNE